MNSSKEGINIHCPNCGFSFEVFDLNLDVYNCPNCDFQIVMRVKEDAIKTPDTKTFIGTIDERPRLKPGSELGGFELISEIGRGGMGVVYKAMQKSLNREVALKILPEHLSDDVEFIKRFQREAQALASLTHPNVVSILDRCESNNIYFFVMEYVNGKSLRQIMRNRRLNTLQVLSIISDISNGLAYAHSKAIIHRDIKPENILIDVNGNVKITDFGLSRILRKDSEFSRITNTAITMGTLDYMSPEQRISSKTADHRSDIYAVGVMMYELLTTEVPVGNFERPSKLEPSLPPVIDEIVLKALKSSSTDRFQSVQQLKEQVDNVLEDLKNQQKAGYNNVDLNFVPKAKPVSDSKSPFERFHKGKWHKHGNDEKKKGFFKTILSYEFLIVAFIISLFFLQFLLPLIGFLFLIRIIFGEVLLNDKSGKRKISDEGSDVNVYTEFDTDPVAAGADNKSPDQDKKNEPQKEKFEAHNAKGFFNDMKKQFKMKYKEIKKQIKADLKHYVNDEKSFNKDEMEAEIDNRVQFEVERKIGMEIERIREVEKTKGPSFGFITVISLVLFVLSVIGIILLGGFIFFKDELYILLFSREFSSIQNLLELSKYAGGALIFSMFLFSLVTSGSCKKYKKYGRSMGLLAVFFTIASGFFWYHEWKSLKGDIIRIESIEIMSRTDADKSAKELSEIVKIPDEFNSPPNSVRIIALKTLFDSNFEEYEKARNELRHSSDDKIRINWIKAARMGNSKPLISDVEDFLSEKNQVIIKETLSFLMEKYPDTSWRIIEEHYPQFSFEIKTWLIDEIGKNTPSGMLKWLMGLDNTKLEKEINTAITKYQTLRTLPYLTDKLFNDNSEIRQKAFQAMKEYPLENVLGVYIAYLKNGSDIELRSEITRFLVKKTDYDEDVDDVNKWESWLKARHEKTINELEIKKKEIEVLTKNSGSIDELIMNADADIEKLKNLYASLCNALNLLYDIRLKMLDSLAPGIYELDLRFSDSNSIVELIEKLENYLKLIEDKHSDKFNKTETSHIKGDYERKKFTYEQRLDESFE